jgi:hypothetical protein
MVSQPLTMRYEEDAPPRIIVKMPMEAANTVEKLKKLLRDILDDCLKA